MSYEQRVHRVMDHVRGHLDGDLSLERLARVAHFSPFHFHRIFKATAGETLASFTRRARLERAVYLMRGAPQRELSSIAVEVGFPTPSELSRVFRARYGVAPSRWDRVSRLDGQTDFVGDRPDVAPHETRVVDRPACRALYVRVKNPWGSPSIREGYARLTAFLDTQRIDWRASSLIGLSWDSDKATELSLLTYDLAIAVPARVHPTDDFGVHELPALRAVEVHCRGLPAIAQAWDYLYERWLPSSRWEPDNLPAVKRFRGVPERFDGMDVWDVDCSIALRRRSA